MLGGQRGHSKPALRCHLWKLNQPMPGFEKPMGLHEQQGLQNLGDGDEIAYRQLCWTELYHSV